MFCSRFVEPPTHAVHLVRHSNLVWLPALNLWPPSLSANILTALSLVTKSISPSLLLLQSCLRVGSAYDTERRVCSAVFAFQMAHEVSCSSSTWISPQEKKASVIHYPFFFCSPFEKQCRFRNKHSVIHSSVIFSLFPTRLRSCVW